MIILGAAEIVKKNL